MTAKETALDLFWDYYNILEHKLSEEYSQYDKQVAIDCAMIHVNKMIEYSVNDNFWNDVKEELVLMIERIN